ncbi:unnamed protein product [Oppiella nova]|uniref:Kazal-like domain-containing protein n=1 Tax=Oppiella nova TaxID=334625 RepID=A0A7R9QRU0_9ACAR|nr:unnamed protein product [Oppiella nova]CAG2172669.1 unnamed protein product [Oppiella nova]
MSPKRRPNREDRRGDHQMPPNLMSQKIRLKSVAQIKGVAKALTNETTRESAPDVKSYVEDTKPIDSFELGDYLWKHCILYYRFGGQLAAITLGCIGAYTTLRSRFGGYYINKTKYIESQFRQSSSGASFLTGATSVLPVAIGIILGGVIIKFIKPRPLTLVIYMFAIEFVTNGALLFGMFTGCPSLNLHSTGLTPDNQFSLNTKCNTGCECTTRVFTPICAEDKMTTYFSPCFAGCNQLDRASGTVSGCSCIGDYEGGGEATTGFCQSDTDNCNNLMPYLVMMTVASIILSTTGTGNALLTLRALDPKDKSFAMGVMGTFMAIFAFIPYPLIFGAVVDSTCLVWESKCGKTGNCWIYDQDKFRYYLHGTALVFVCVGSLMDLGIIYNAKHIKNFYDDSYDTSDTLGQ